VKILAPFSNRATKEDRIAFIFRIYDVDGDGIVSPDDLELMVRMLAGKSLRYCNILPF
jgi:serine/threonine-protein phosphatase 2B regulatory subunit